MYGRSCISAGPCYTTCLQQSQPRPVQSAVCSDPGGDGWAKGLARLDPFLSSRRRRMGAQVAPLTLQPHGLRVISAVDRDSTTSRLQSLPKGSDAQFPLVRRSSPASASGAGRGPIVVTGRSLVMTPRKNGKTKVLEVGTHLASHSHRLSLFHTLYGVRTCVLFPSSETYPWTCQRIMLPSACTQQARWSVACC